MPVRGMESEPHSGFGGTPNYDTSIDNTFSSLQSHKPRVELLCQMFNMSQDTLFHSYLYTSVLKLPISNTHILLNIVKHIGLEINIEKQNI